MPSKGCPIEFNYISLYKYLILYSKYIIIHIMPLDFINNASNIILIYIVLHYYSHFVCNAEFEHHFLQINRAEALIKISVNCNSRTKRGCYEISQDVSYRHVGRDDPGNNRLLTVRF